jgi:hypothetical protein
MGQGHQRDDEFHLVLVVIKRSSEACDGGSAACPSSRLIGMAAFPLGTCQAARRDSHENLLDSMAVDSDAEFFPAPFGEDRHRAARPWRGGKPRTRFERTANIWCPDLSVNANSTQVSTSA